MRGGVQTAVAGRRVTQCLGERLRHRTTLFVEQALHEILLGVDFGQHSHVPQQLKRDEGPGGEQVRVEAIGHTRITCAENYSWSISVDTARTNSRRGPCRPKR